MAQRGGHVFIDIAEHRTQVLFNNNRLLEVHSGNTLWLFISNERDMLSGHMIIERCVICLVWCCSSAFRQKDQRTKALSIKWCFSHKRSSSLKAVLMATFKET